jgi:ComF family protein
LWSRRFNQAAALAKTISRLSNVPVAYGALARVRATRQQVGLTQAERATNVQGAFRVPDTSRAELRGKRVVLVDDVLTSGATLDVCSRILLRAGAANVDALVFARVVQPHRSAI